MDIFIYAQKSLAVDVVGVREICPNLFVSMAAVSFDCSLMVTYRWVTTTYRDKTTATCLREWGGAWTTRSQVNTVPSCIHWLRPECCWCLIPYGLYLCIHHGVILAAQPTKRSIQSQELIRQVESFLFLPKDFISKQNWEVIFFYDRRTCSRVIAGWRCLFDGYRMRARRILQNGNVQLQDKLHCHWKVLLEKLVWTPYQRFLELTIALRGYSGLLYEVDI